MGYMINITTYEVQNCPSEAVMISNGWPITEWKFVEELEQFIDYALVQAKQSEVEKLAKKAELQTQLNELELKRARAMAEPEVKDIETGETWLEYRTKQIQALRVELNTL